MGSGASRERRKQAKAGLIDCETTSGRPRQHADTMAVRQAASVNGTTAAPIADDSDEETLQLQQQGSNEPSPSEVVLPFNDPDTRDTTQTPTTAIVADPATPASPDEAHALLARYANHIFERADLDQDQFLNQNEFCNLVFSRTLDLRITEEDAFAMLAAYGNEQGHVSQADFYEVMLHLIQLYSQARAQEQEEGWQWFGMYFDDDPNALPAYFNTKTAELTYERPEHYVNTRVVETQSFEDLELTDGTVSGVV